MIPNESDKHNKMLRHVEYKHCEYMDIALFDQRQKSLDYLMHNMTTWAEANENEQQRVQTWSTLSERTTLSDTQIFSSKVKNFYRFCLCPLKSWLETLLSLVVQQMFPHFSYTKIYRRIWSKRNF